MKSQHIFSLVSLVFFSGITIGVAQNRDFRSERIVLDDDANDGTMNTLTIQVPASLGQDVVLTIPDPGTGTGSFLLSNGASSSWLLGGNAGTTAGTNYVGTSDNTPLHLYVNGGANNSLILNSNGSLQRDAAGNGRGSYAVDLQTSRSSVNQVAAGDRATISGGRSNRASGDFSAVGGGFANVASGNTSTIGGGNGNLASGSRATIAGGDGGEVSAQYATVGGGHDNAVVEDWSTVGGGRENTVSSATNASAPDASYSVIAGGRLNEVSHRYGTVAGGRQNEVSGSDGTVGGGSSNTVSASNATVGGGTNNDATAPSSTVGGGSSNDIDVDGDYSTIGGGSSNDITGEYSSILGGRNNEINGDHSSVIGGRDLTLDGDGSLGFIGSTTTGNGMTVAASEVAVLGNVDLWLANNDGAASQLRLYEDYGTSGAFPNTANYISFQAPATITADVEYLLPPNGGAVGRQLTVTAITGATVTLGWGAASDRLKKTDFLPLSGEDVLIRFRELELGSWRYDPSIDPHGPRHYGVMAQDFHQAFGRDELGTIGNDTTVVDIDLHGVSYLAIQGLEERTTEQAGQIDALLRENAQLHRRNVELQERLARLEEVLIGAPKE